MVARVVDRRCDNNVVPTVTRIVPFLKRFISHIRSVTGSVSVVGVYRELGDQSLINKSADAWYWYRFWVELGQQISSHTGGCNHPLWLIAVKKEETIAAYSTRAVAKQEHAMDAAAAMRDPASHTNEEVDGVPEFNDACPEDDPPRLVLRNLPFDQSRNIIQVKHNQGTTKIGRLIRHDFFHVLLQLSTVKIIFLMLALWTFSILFFAAMYVAVNNRHGTGVCNLGLPDQPLYYYTAFAFALQTQQATGYGLPNGTNAFFEDCPALITVVYFQMTSSLFFNGAYVCKRWPTLNTDLTNSLLPQHSSLE